MNLKVKSTWISIQREKIYLIFNLALEGYRFTNKMLFKKSNKEELNNRESEIKENNNNSIRVKNNIREGVKS